MRTGMWLWAGMVSALIAAAASTSPVAVASEGESAVKWAQPPKADNPRVWYYSAEPAGGPPPPARPAADDFQCNDPRPVTDAHWWGAQALGEGGIFRIRFYADVPAGGDPDPRVKWSHPGAVLYEVDVENWSQVWDEAAQAWYFSVDLPQPFNQEPGRIYWFSTAYVHNEFGWNWLQSSQDPYWNDAAVNWNPETGRWEPGDPKTDLSFELTVAGPTYKWNQPPVNAAPENVFYGWNEMSWYAGPQIVADDWVCMGPDPVTDLHWWGSYLNWTGTQPPPVTPMAFDIAIWTDVPAGVDRPYSHPGQVIWKIRCTNFTSSFVGWDYDPRTGRYEACYRYDQFLLPQEYFYQAGGPITSIFWVSISAVYSPGAPVEHPWGWKTRPRDPASLAPDDAVVIWMPTAPVEGSQFMEGLPIEWPEGQSWDMAFELGTVQGQAFKWSQWPMGYYPPDAFHGWDEYSVYGSRRQIVADDWRCTTPDPVTDVHWWGSFIGWSEPYPPEVGLPDAFHIAIWTDVPPNGAGFSHPGVVKWSYVCRDYRWTFVGWDFDPRGIHPPEACFKFECDIPEELWFRQDPGENIYWVSIAAMYPTAQEVPYPWGWKTRPRDPESPAPDDAVRIFVPTAPEPGMLFEQGMPIEWPDGVSWDMAFALSTQPVSVTEDFGDAPERPYPTTLAANGARHKVLPGLMLGGQIDAEADGQPDPNALGDDNSNLDDEDGVVFLGAIYPGAAVTVEVTLTSDLAESAKLDAWLDFGGDGSWLQPGDQIFANQTIWPGVNSLSFLVPMDAAPGRTFARFRMSLAGGLAPDGPAPDGEVEDYAVQIEEAPQYDLGDAPDSSNSFGVPMTAYPPGGPLGVRANFPTVYQAGSPPYGPLHRQPLAVAYLGQGVSLENEADVGPDQDGGNNILPPRDLPDQDWMDDAVNPWMLRLPHCRRVRMPYTVTIVNVLPNVQLFVNVWFDWNRDGDFDDVMQCPPGISVPEWAVQNQALADLVPGVHVLTTPPFRAWSPSPSGQADPPLWMRITLSEQKWSPAGPVEGWGGSGPVGGYAYGETEDYYVVPLPPEFALEFSVDIGSDGELSDPNIDGDERFDPGDVYWWKDVPLPAGGADGFKDDAMIFGQDPWPDPPDPVVPPATRVPVGQAFPPPEQWYHRYFDLDGHDQIDMDLREFIPPQGPAPGPIPRFPSQCIHEPWYLFVSYDDDQAPGWLLWFMDVPVTAPSSGGVSSYGEAKTWDEVIGLALAPPPWAPAMYRFMYPVADEATVHPSLAPSPDAGEQDDDDLDSLDVTPLAVPVGENQPMQSCSFWYFTCDHEATGTMPVGAPLDPGAIYEVTPLGPTKVIDGTRHLGLRVGTDVDAFEFAWLWNQEMGGWVLGLLFSVDEDDPLTPLADESGGLDPRAVYASLFTGNHFLFLRPLADDIDGLAIWWTPIENCNDPAQDVDGDGDVDVNDFAKFQVCFNGPGQPWAGDPKDCTCFDQDDDGDVDVSDFAVFQVCFNGPGNPPPPACP